MSGRVVQALVALAASDVTALLPLSLSSSSFSELIKAALERRLRLRDAMDDPPSTSSTSPSTSPSWGSALSQLVNAHSEVARTLYLTVQRRLDLALDECALPLSLSSPSRVSVLWCREASAEAFKTRSERAHEAAVQWESLLRVARVRALLVATARRGDGDGDGPRTAVLRRALTDTLRFLALAPSLPAHLVLVPFTPSLSPSLSTRSLPPSHGRPMAQTWRLLCRMPCTVPRRLLGCRRRVRRCVC